MTGPGPRVLVIEDDPLSLELVISVLETLPCAMIAAATAEAGLELAIAEPPALILLDLWLPAMSGQDALERIRAHPALHQVPVIAITAHAMQGDEVRALRAGFDAYLSKPVDNRRLRELVRRFLGLPGPA